MYEYQRTCQRCQTTWFVPAEIGEAKPLKKAKGAGWFTPIVGAKRQALRADAALIEQQNRDLTAAGQCPQCGSSAFQQERQDL